MVANLEKNIDLLLLKYIPKIKKNHKSLGDIFQQNISTLVPQEVQ